MCQPKYWNKIYTKEVVEDRHTSIITIFAERSDLEIIELEIILDDNDCLENIAKKVRKAIDSLESYRDCDCTAKLGTCAKHLSNVVINEFLGGPKLAVTIRKR